MAIYMKYEGIEGTGTGKYKGWIELESCHPRFRAPSGTGTLEPRINCSKFLDNSSHRIFGAASAGSLAGATIAFEKGNEAPFLVIELENASIVDATFGRSEVGEKPMHFFSLNYTAASISKSPTASSKDTKDAKEKAMWNLIAK